MVDKIQDLVLPNTVVTRLIKEALPDGINIGKEARAAISRAAAIFNNVFSALEEIEFESFIQPLRESLESFRTASKEKKATKMNGNKSAANTNGHVADADMDDDVNESNMEEITDGTEIEE